MRDISPRRVKVIKRQQMFNSLPLSLTPLSAHIKANHSSLEILLQTPNNSPIISLPVSLIDTEKQQRSVCTFCEQIFCNETIPRLYYEHKAIKARVSTRLRPREAQFFCFYLFFPSINLNIIDILYCSCLYIIMLFYFSVRSQGMGFVVVVVEVFFFILLYDFFFSFTHLLVKVMCLVIFHYESSGRCELLLLTWFKAKTEEKKKQIKIFEEEEKKI